MLGSEVCGQFCVGVQCFFGVFLDLFDLDFCMRVECDEVGGCVGIEWFFREQSVNMICDIVYCCWYCLVFIIGECVDDDVVKIVLLFGVNVVKQVLQFGGVSNVLQMLIIMRMEIKGDCKSVVGC